MPRVERRPACRTAQSCFAGRSTRCLHHVLRRSRIVGALRGRNSHLPRLSQPEDVAADYLSAESMLSMLSSTCSTVRSFPA